MRAFVVRREAGGGVHAEVEPLPLADLPDGDVRVRVVRSSLNYKDALAATGHAGVVRSFPHVPGIDAAGVVEESSVDSIRPGDRVLVTSHDLGAGRWGAWAERIRVPASWVLPLPEGWSEEEAMALGTAGLTAALSVDALQRATVTPESGDVLVTGATGGVGVLAVMLLARLGYRVVALSGKSDRASWLEGLGASEVLPREELDADPERPLLRPRWAGAIDTVGGRPLVRLLRAIRSHGCVAACGLVAGSDLPGTVFPFILRGVTLAGIDSAWCPAGRRRRAWERLAGEWRLSGLERITREVGLEGLGAEVDRILGGRAAGRVVVRPSPA